MSADFDRNMVIVVALQSLSFVVRNTSPIGWVGILLLKGVEKGNLFKICLNYLMAFVLIFIPIVGISIAADS
jgi:hypothetical protein